MQTLPLIGGSYSTRSVLANCQRCINLYPEINRPDSPSPTTHYQRPGLAVLSSPGSQGQGRACYQASNGDGYAVAGQGVYYIDSSWTWNLIGTLNTVANNPVSIQDNGTQVMLVDGSQYGYTWNLADHGAASWAVINDVSFTGADRVDTIDTFLLWNVPGTRNFRSSLSNQVTPMDPLYIAGKTNYPDPLETLIVNRHLILLLGSYKTEVWYDSGNAQFPFAELPGVYVEHGIVAKYSIAAAGEEVYWVGRNLQGQGVVYRQRGYKCERISNYALEYQIRLMYAAGTIADAVGSTYQQDGHTFYVLSFPTGNQTWCWDSSVEDPQAGWSQRCWTDGQGQLQRWRGVFCTALYGKNVTLDWEYGTLYEQSLTTYTDTVYGATGPISYIRSFPHLLAGRDAQGKPILAEGNMVRHDRFMLNASVGTASSAGPQFSLRWSDDRGVTWVEEQLLSAGEPGNYETRPEWAGLGMAMDRVYEVAWSFPGEVALNGAWVDGQVMQR